jgi:phage tail-like protein
MSTPHTWPLAPSPPTAPPPPPPSQVIPPGDKYLEEGVPRIYEMLIKPIRDLDQRYGRELLRRFLMRPDELWSQWMAKMRSLPTLRSPVDCREDLLPFLQSGVGFGRDLDAITSRLDTPTRRKLVKLAVPLWKRRSTPLGITEWIRFLTGREVSMRSWFDMRWILGEGQLGENQEGNDSWVTGGDGDTTYGEFWSNLRIMDIGGLDCQLVLDLLSLSRPIGERIELVVLDFLDTFASGVRTNWSHVSGPLGEVDPTTLDFVLHPGTVEDAIIPVVLNAQIVDCITQHKMTLGAPAPTDNVHIVRFMFADQNNHYVVTFSSDGGAELSRVAGGVVTSLATKTPLAGRQMGLPIVPGCGYTIRTQVVRTAGVNHVKVYVDETEWFAADDTAAAPAHGGLRLEGHNSNTADNRIDEVEVFRLPGRNATLTPSGITMSSTFSTP